MSKKYYGQLANINHITVVSIFFVKPETTTPETSERQLHSQCQYLIMGFSLQHMFANYVIVQLHT